MMEVTAASVCYIKIIIYRTTMSHFHIDLWLLLYTHNALVIPDDDNNVTEVRVGLKDDEILCIIITEQIILINKTFSQLSSSMSNTNPKFPT